MSSDYTPEIAYPLRARLARVVNESTRWVDSGSCASELVQAIHRLGDLSAHLMQPSELFDGRWQKQWGEVRENAILIQGYLSMERTEVAGSD